MESPVEGCKEDRYRYCTHPCRPSFPGKTIENPSENELLCDRGQEARRKKKDRFPSHPFKKGNAEKTFQKNERNNSREPEKRCQEN